MSERKGYAGASKAVTGKVQLRSAWPRVLGGEAFEPGIAYDADMPAVQANRRWFRVADAPPEPAAKPKRKAKPAEKPADTED